MNKVSIKGLPFKLNGDIVEKGTKLNFQALDGNNNIVSSKDFKGLTIISAFPDINTSVCDKQTREIMKLAKEHKDVNFVSITRDSVEVINKWCAANELENISILSDNNTDFGNKTNTLITKIDKLARGFIIVKDGEIIEIEYKKEIATDPNYEVLNKYI